MLSVYSEKDLRVITYDSEVMTLGSCKFWFILQCPSREKKFLFVRINNFCLHLFPFESPVNSSFRFNVFTNLIYRDWKYKIMKLFDWVWPTILGQAVYSQNTTVFNPRSYYFEEWFNSF